MPGIAPTSSLPQVEQDYLAKLTGAYAYIASHLNNPSSEPAVAAVPGAKYFFHVKACSLDSDGDGLNDDEEFARNSNPFLEDSDGDGITDLEEAKDGGDPCNPSVQPFDSAHPPQFANIWVDANYVPPPGVEMDGSRDFPFDDLNRALVAANSGDLIGVRAGTYEWFVKLNPLIEKSLRFVGVDGPTATHIRFHHHGRIIGHKLHGVIESNLGNSSR